MELRHSLKGHKMLVKIGEILKNSIDSTFKKSTLFGLYILFLTLGMYFVPNLIFWLYFFLGVYLATIEFKIWVEQLTSDE